MRHFRKAELGKPIESWAERWLGRSVATTLMGQSLLSVPLPRTAEIERDHSEHSLRGSKASSDVLTTVAV